MNIHWKYKRIGDIVFSVIEINGNKYIQARSIKMPAQKLLSAQDIIEGIKDE